MGSKVWLQPKWIHHSKQKCESHINTAKTAAPDLCKYFPDSIKQPLQACPARHVNERLNHVYDVIYKTAMDIFDKTEKQNPDCFETGIAEMAPVNELLSPTGCCTNNYWLKLSNSMQLSADCGNIWSMHEGIKNALGPNKIQTAPLKSSTGEVITDHGQHIERWIKHYIELYSEENIITDVAFANIESLSVIQECDELPNIEELGKAIHSIACCKAPGKNSIPPKVMKDGKQTGLLQYLHDLMYQCWIKIRVPEDIHDANTVTVYKNKGDCNGCNN